MLHIGIFVSERCIGSGVYAILDILTAANYVNRKYLKAEEDLCHFTLIGQETWQNAYNGQRIGPLTPIDQVTRPDVVIVPGMIEAVVPTHYFKKMVDHYHTWVPKLKEWHQQGTLMTAACSGNFLYVEAGITRQRPFTCHWASEKAAKELYPTENIHTEKMMFDHGDFISMGGASSISQLTLYILERFAGRELAIYCAKLMLIDMDCGEQAPFALFSPNKRHEDKLVKQMQQWMEQHYHEAISVQSMGDKWNMSERQLSRRFKTATGETPGNYLQKLRLEHVKRGLETKQLPSNNLIWESGYEDVSSFRRLFKRETGMTMKEYKQRFGLHVH